MNSCQAAICMLVADLSWQQSPLIGEASVSLPHGQKELVFAERFNHTSHATVHTFNFDLVYKY